MASITIKRPDGSSLSLKHSPDDSPSSLSSLLDASAPHLPTSPVHPPAAQPTAEATTGPTGNGSPKESDPYARKVEQMRDHWILANIEKYMKLHGISQGAAAEKVARNLALSGRFSVQEARSRVGGLIQGDLSSMDAPLVGPAPLSPAMATGGAKESANADLFKAASQRVAYTPVPSMSGAMGYGTQQWNNARRPTLQPFVQDPPIQGSFRSQGMVEPDAFPLE